MKLAGWISFLVGLALLGAVLALTDLGAVFQALVLVGWGIVALILVRLVVHVADTISWAALLDATRPSFWRLLWIWLVGDAVNSLLPVAQVGGELARARLLAQGGVRGAMAAASIVVGVTLSLLTLILFGAAGAVLLVIEVGPGSRTTALGIGVGIGTLTAILAGFFLAQHNGLFLRLAQLLERIVGGQEWLSLTGGAGALDAAVVALYGRPRAVLACGFWRLFGWSFGTLEMWLALALLGHPISWSEAFIMESLGQALRSAGFAVPGALGVQEGAFVLLGAILGIPTELAVGTSLLRRLRDLAYGLPFILSWHWAESVALARRARQSAAPHSAAPGDKPPPPL